MSIGPSKVGYKRAKKVEVSLLYMKKTRPASRDIIHESVATGG